MSIRSRLTKIVWFYKTYGQHAPLVISAILDFRCKMSIIEGQLKGTETELSIAYVGRGRNFHYIVRTFFVDYRVRSQSKSTIFKYLPVLAGDEFDADLLIADIGWPYHRIINRQGNFLEIPDWLSMGMDLGEDWNSIAQNFKRDVRKNDLRRIRRNAFHYKESRTAKDLRDFYDRMYLPYMKHVHGEDAHLAPRWFVVRQGRNGVLLKVCNENGVVSAGVVYPEDGVLVALWMGVPIADFEERPEASISALYYYLLTYALDKGYRAVDFAGTRAYLNDGPFRFKRKWGAVIEDTFSPSSMLLQVLEANERSVEFCERFPVLARSDAGLDAVVLTSNGNASLDDIVRHHDTAGTDRVVTVFLGGGDESPEVKQTESGGESISVSVSIADLPRIYCRGWLNSLNRQDHSPGRVLQEEAFERVDNPGKGAAP